MKPLSQKIRQHLPATCEYPGCQVKQNLQAHHIKPRRENGPGTLLNLIRLCAPHHLHADRDHPGYERQSLWQYTLARESLRRLPFDWRVFAFSEVEVDRLRDSGTDWWPSPSYPTQKHKKRKKKPNDPANPRTERAD